MQGRSLPRLPQLRRHRCSPGRTPRTLRGPAVASPRSTWLASARESSVTSEDVPRTQRWRQPSRLGLSRAGEDDPRGCRSCFLRSPGGRRCRGARGKGSARGEGAAQRSAVTLSRRPAQPDTLPKKRGTWAPSGTCSTTKQGSSRAPLLVSKPVVTDSPTADRLDRRPGQRAARGRGSVSRPDGGDSGASVLWPAGLPAGQEAGAEDSDRRDPHPV